MTNMMASVACSLSSAPTLRARHTLNSKSQHLRRRISASMPLSPLDRRLSTDRTGQADRCPSAFSLAIFELLLHIVLAYCFPMDSPTEDNSRSRSESHHSSRLFPLGWSGSCTRVVRISETLFERRFNLIFGRYCLRKTNKNLSRIVKSLHAAVRETSVSSESLPHRLQRDSRVSELHLNRGSAAKVNTVFQTLLPDDNDPGNNDHQRQQASQEFCTLENQFLFLKKIHISFLYS